MNKMNYSEQLEIALNYEPQHDEGLKSLDTTSMLLFLICHEYNRMEKEQAHEYENKPEVKEKIVSLMNYYIKEGHEPRFDLGPNWWYAILCECITLVKYRPMLWKLFDEDEQARMVQLMKMYAYMWNFGCNEENSYQTGWGMRGNYGKWRGPNYRLTNNALILYLISFFGSIDELNRLYANFDYDKEKQELEKFKFYYALTAWCKEDFVDNSGVTRNGAKKLLEEGGDAYILWREYDNTNCYYRGTGKGVKIPVAYHDSIPYGIIHALYNNCFSGGACVNGIIIEDEWYGLEDNKITPTFGKQGMMLEFNMEEDGLGPRSSLLHCLTDFYLVTGFAVTSWFARISKLQVYKQYDKVCTGIEDFLYKYSVGYRSYSLGREERPIHEDLKGVELWGNYWADHYDVKLV